MDIRPNTTVALYCRLSRDDENLQGDSNSDSIANQKKILSKYAEDNNFRNTRFFVEMITLSLIQCNDCTEGENLTLKVGRGIVK